MMRQDTRAINDCTTTETFDFAIKNMVENIMHTWHAHYREANPHHIPNGVDKNIALMAIQAKVYQAIQSKGEQWVPLRPTALIESDGGR